MADAANIINELTADQLASLFGVSARTIRELAQRGVIPRAARNRYPLVTSIRGYTGHLRDAAAARGQDASLTAERARQAREQADNLALRNAALRRDLVPAVEVEARLTGVFRKVRAGMLAVSARAAQRLPHLSTADVATIDREVRAVLTELGEADVE